MVSLRAFRPLLVILVLLTAFMGSAAAQQTGSIAGKVTDTAGLVLPGVTVEARSDVLPAARVVVTEANGEYRLPALPPGSYTLTFVLAGMQNVTRQAQVQLAQETIVDATLGLQAVAETVNVTASATLIERDSATVKSGVSNEQIMALPVGQEYRDLLKLIPAVQVTQDATRGPSAGGSGQDNIYQFDGANVTLPLFGTLSAEPASHDIAQVTMVRGGARAVDFDRSGGFTIDSVSKSGGNRFAGEVSYQLQTEDMTAALNSGSRSRYQQDRSWFTANIGGPVVPNKLHFYASFYHPETSRGDRSNAYGPLPDYKRSRNEGFGKLTFSPTGSILINGTWRDSKREDTSDLFAENSAATSGSGSEARQQIGTADGSWILSNRSLATFKITRFALKTLGRPDNVANVRIDTTPGTRIDLNQLDTIGRFQVPAPIAGQTAFNEFIQPLIDRYGYVDGNTRVGGGIVGYGSQFDRNDFYRTGAQAAYNITLGSTVSHELHVGYQWYVDEEDLERTSNGWGLITVPGGRLSFQGQPIYFTAAFQQQTTGLVPVIHSEYHSQSFEVNDTIRYNNFSFNLGIVASNDTLYGQGLREDSSTLSGYVAAPGNKYKMHSVPFSKMIQPRVSATWAYNGRDTVYASYARYNPAASSLPRAASWDRNLATTINAHFDQNGVLFGSTPVASSSGKLFADDLTPRSIDEYIVGTAKQLTPQASVRLYGRYRKGAHYWEDTNNDARILFRNERTPSSVPAELYIPDLDAKRAQIGSGSTYVIAELDGAFTKYYEATAEAEWRNERTFLRGSYTWSHYFGNFDQDNSTLGNDDNIFIGSSFIADGAGRQLWDFRHGDLRGDRRHMLKLYGFQALEWNATIGAFFFAQSGQPWEMWSYEPYIALTTNTSDTSRFAEPAGSRRTDPHWQLDLNYTQNVRLPNGLNFQVAGDLFNVFDKQTGYNIQPGVHTPSTFGQPRSYFDPRRFQLAVRFHF